MALMTSHFGRSKGLLQVLERNHPSAERSVELNKRLLAINDLSAAMHSATDLGQLEKHLARAYREWMPGESVQICLREGESYRCTRLSGGPNRSSDAAFPAEHGIVGSVMESGVPRWIPDTWGSRGLIPGLTETVIENQARAMIVLPLTAGGKSIGALELASDMPGRFDEIDFHLNHLVSKHLSASLDIILTRQSLAEANARLKEQQQRLAKLNADLEQLAHTDHLTGLANTRRLSEQLRAEIARVDRYGEVLSCLMLDLDDFKRVNDSHGHHFGDKVLQQFALLLRRFTRGSDFVARYGGEEFTILLPRSDRIGALLMAENLRTRIRDAAFGDESCELRLTVSIGIATRVRFDALDAPALLIRADNALYQAKRLGKDRVCHCESLEKQETA